MQARRDFVTLTSRAPCLHLAYQAPNRTVPGAQAHRADRGCRTYLARKRAVLTVVAVLPLRLPGAQARRADW